jgi:ribosome maturation factor RimP
MVAPVIEGLGLELVDLELLGSGSRTVLRIYVDEKGGVDLERCADASRAVSDVLDRKDPIGSRYTLQVSSPGIDRPLRTERDFIRNVGRNVAVTVEVNGIRQKIDGRIVDAVDGTIKLDVSGQISRISLESILLAKLTVEF